MAGLPKKSSIEHILGRQISVVATYVLIPAPFLKAQKPVRAPFFNGKGEKVLKSGASSPQFEAGKELLAFSEAVLPGPIPPW